MQTQSFLRRKISPVITLIIWLFTGLIVGKMALTSTHQPFLDSLFDSLPTDQALVQWLTIG